MYIFSGVYKGPLVDEVIADDTKGDTVYKCKKCRYDGIFLIIFVDISNYCSCLLFLAHTSAHVKYVKYAIYPSIIGLFQNTRYNCGKDCSWCHGVELLNCFWCNKGHNMYYHIWVGTYKI